MNGKTRWYSILLIGLVLLLASSVVGCAPTSAPAPSATPELAPEIEDGWIRIKIEGVGSIDYPSNFLELQSQEYRDIGAEHYQIVLGKSDFILQQVGLNDLLPSAFDEYRRVMFWTSYLNPGEEVFRANEKYTMSQEELAELENQLVDRLLQEFEILKTMESGNKLVESVSLEIKEVNVMFPIVHTYKRQLNDNPVVLVEAYMFQNYDKIHYLTFSCRVVDEAECRDIYDEILDSFRLQ